MPAILETSQNTQTKYIALQIMDRLIKTRWKVLPEEQRSGIRNFVVQVIVKTSSDEQTLKREKSFVNKLNLILVQILKQEWSVFPSTAPHLAELTRFFSLAISSPALSPLDTRPVCLRQAAQLADLHPRNRHVVAGQPLDLRKQHGHPQAPLRRDFRVLGRADDDGQDQGAQGADRECRRIVATACAAGEGSSIPLPLLRSRGPATDRSVVPLPALQCQEFAEVFSLCVEVLEKADKASLIKVTLEAMLRFLNWIPLGYIFETPVIDHLITRVRLALRSLPVQRAMSCPSLVRRSA